MIAAQRYHDISTGHRVTGHESKCAHLHGHNYRIHFSVSAGERLDSVGRVVDFSVIKDVLCEWLEQNWDHKFLIWEQDPQAGALKELDPDGVVLVPFNPTAENMGLYLLNFVGQNLIFTHGVLLEAVKIEETAKCSVAVLGKGNNAS